MSNTKKSRLPFFQLEKPDLSKLDKSLVFDKLDKSVDEFTQFLQRSNESPYLYWDRFKYKEAPPNFTTEESWFLIRQFRTFVSRKTPIRTEKEENFRWVRLPHVDEFLHKIDISSGGQILATMDSLSETNKQKFLSRGILEEAIASSQLEGAHTTRQAAKDMIVERREPRNSDEQMILNNYNTIIRIDEDFKNQPLSETLLFELHKLLTEKTELPIEKQGQYRKDSDGIVVQGQIGSEEYITYVPPKENFFKVEIKKLIDYANDKDNDTFLHPIIKAIFLHFWFGYLHPFPDGNGRLARALFYWYLIRKGYWTFMYLPISMIIKRAPVQYAMAYIYSEQDSNDITYFFDFHLRKIMQALRDFNEYVGKKISENKEIDRIVSKSIPLIDRQKYLIHHLISENNTYTTITSHATLNSISRQTAAKDIKKLEGEGLIEGRREGKYIRYKATEKLLTMAANN